MQPYQKTYHMPSGEYYVGDLCYVLTEAQQNAFFALTCTAYQQLDGLFVHPEGFTTVHFCTDDGPCTYNDQKHLLYHVDSEVLGFICTKDLPANADVSRGHLHTFDAPFECYSHLGVLHFGHIVIDTVNEDGKDPHHIEEDLF